MSGVPLTQMTVPLDLWVRFGKQISPEKTRCCVARSTIGLSQGCTLSSIPKYPQGSLLLQRVAPADKGFLKVASISSHFPFVIPGIPETTMHSNQSFEIILAINRESMLVDPIDWDRFSGKMREWGKLMCPNLTITPLTDHLFGERTSGSHKPRSFKPPTPNRPHLYVL